MRDLDGPDESGTSQESADRQVHRGGVTWWEEGRSARSHREAAERSARQSGRYRPYEMPEYRESPRSQQPLERRRYDRHGAGSRGRRRASNSAEEGGDDEFDDSSYDRSDESRYDRRGDSYSRRRRDRPSDSSGDSHNSNRKEPTSNSSPHLPSKAPDHQVMAHLVQEYLKSLPDEQRKAMYQDAAFGTTRPDSEHLKTGDASTSFVKAAEEEVVGLLPAPPAADCAEFDDPAPDYADMERAHSALDKLARMANVKVRPDDETAAVLEWFQPILAKFEGGAITSHLAAWRECEDSTREAIIKVATRAHTKAVELNAKALVEIEKIEAAEKEKRRLVEDAREDFKKILSGQQPELDLLRASLEEKTKTFRKKAEKLLTPEQIGEEAIARVQRRRSKSRR